LTTTHDLLAVLAGAIFLLPCYVFSWLSASNPMSARRIARTRMPLSSVCIAALREECLQIHLPRTLSEAQEVTEGFLQHSNTQRPHQGRRACGNQPPRVACPDFPLLPPVPLVVDADSWLAYVHQRAFARAVQTNGNVSINHESYYIQRALAGQRVACFVNAPAKCFDIWQGEHLIKQVAIKGLYGKMLPFDEYVTLMKQEARWRIPSLSSDPSGAHARSFVGLVSL
jgi:integrase-like protein